MSKLSETQVVVLSTAAQHDDGNAALPDRLRGRAAVKVIEPLLAKGFLEERPAAPGVPAWRRDEDGGQSYALTITPAGRDAISIEQGKRIKNVTDAGPDKTANVEAAKPASKAVTSKRKPGPKTIAARAVKRQTPRRPKRKPQQDESRPNSKQARVLAMLRKPAGTTIATIMKTTGWQQHSVRGFFAGVVRRKLRLDLSSKKTKGDRIYRINGRPPSSMPLKQTSKRA